MAKKTKRYAAGDEIVVTGSMPGSDSGINIQNLDYRLPRMDSSNRGNLGIGGGGGGGRSITPSNSKMSVGKVRTPVGKVFGLRGIPVGKGSLSVGASPMGGGKVGGTFSTSFKKGGKLPDLTGDGKVTRADVLKGRGVPGFKKGSKVSAAEAVHKHERAKHKGQPLTKMAKGGSASKRGDGCATKGKTKGRFV